MSDEERDDDEEARKARAASLRDRIGRLAGGRARAQSSADDEGAREESEGSREGDEGSREEGDLAGERPRPKESPRDFIHRRMHELEEEKGEEK